MRFSGCGLSWQHPKPESWPTQIVETGDTDKAKKLLGTDTVTRRERDQIVRRAETAARNDDVADRLSNGDISVAQLDVIANADTKTNGKAATDETFINQIASVNPDQAKRVADRFIADATKPEEVESEHNRQRRLRRAFRHQTANGLDALTLEGDKISIDRIFKQIQDNAQRSPRKPSHTNSDPAEERSWSQHLFDAATKLLHGSQTQHGTNSRPKIVVAVTLDNLTSDGPGEPLAVQYGTGLIPNHVLARYWCDSDLVGAIFDRKGNPLWLGRSRRTATNTQPIALIARDESCVLCGADHDRCEAHHLIPFNAPAKGRTDIDNLALVCWHCHDELHQQQQTLTRTRDGTWQTRPATPNERPPPKRSG